MLARLLPTVRSLGADAARAVARAFGRLSWPAYWLLVLTGIWNYLAIAPASAPGNWNVVFGVKMLAVLIAVAGSYPHTSAHTPKARGPYAGLDPLGSVAALVLGVALTG